MWEWLNHNAGSVQAAASVVTVVLTTVLVVVTWQYVRLTRKLADAATAQLRSQEKASAVESRELHNLISRLWSMVAELPRAANERDVDTRMRSAPSWNDFPFDRFNSLAASLSFQAGEYASRVTQRLKWLADRKSEVTSVKPQIGYNWNGFLWGEWSNNIALIYQDLDSLNRERAGLAEPKK